ncbi:MAG: hypothetical protein HGB19_06820 [Chlorobiales bacterium]|nr:hypothetical protein [Chlorobiales bacterium]
MQETNTSLRQGKSSARPTVDAIKQQFQRLNGNIGALVEEVSHLKSEKKALQLELNKVIDQVKTLSQEISQAKALSQLILERHALVDDKSGFAPLIISHEEKLLIRQRLMQALEKIDLELQRF